MNTTTRLRQACFACFVAVWSAAPIATTHAAVQLPHSQFLQLAQSSSSLSAADAAVLVKRKTGGQVLSVTTVATDNGKVHRVKVLLTGGRVKVFKVRASGG